jgi:lysophospholipase L1-like esterase
MRMLSIRLAVLAALGASSAAAATPSPAPRWVASWGASMVQTNPPSNGEYDNQTLRTIVHISSGGKGVRLRISNEYGKQTLSFGAIHVAVSAGQSRIQPGSDRVVTFSGQPTLDVPAGSVAVSDPINGYVPGGINLTVSLYATRTSIITQHVWALQTIYIADGDQTAAAQLPGAAQTQSRPFIAGLDVLGSPVAGSVVALGDSITDGFFSDSDKNDRWPDLLGARLRATYGNRVGIVDQGISGNTLLGNVGPTASARFTTDVIAQPGRQWVMLMIGINDIGQTQSKPGQAPGIEALISADRQMIARAHDAGLKIIGMTLTPFQGAGYFSTEGEKKREALNDFIRGSGEFDGVVDSDAAVRDPADPHRYLPIYDSGDHLHPSEPGMQAIANAVDLSLFARP